MADRYDVNNPYTNKLSNNVEINNVKINGEIDLRGTIITGDKVVSGSGNLAILNNSNVTTKIESSNTLLYGSHWETSNGSEMINIFGYGRPTPRKVESFSNIHGNINTPGVFSNSFGYMSLSSPIRTDYLTNMVNNTNVQPNEDINVLKNESFNIYDGSNFKVRDWNGFDIETTSNYMFPCIINRDIYDKMYDSGKIYPNHGALPPASGRVYPFRTINNNLIPPQVGVGGFYRIKRNLYLQDRDGGPISTNGLSFNISPSNVNTSVILFDSSTDKLLCQVNDVVDQVSDINDNYNTFLRGMKKIGSIPLLYSVDAPASNGRSCCSISSRIRLIFASDPADFINNGDPGFFDTGDSFLNTNCFMSTVEYDFHFRGSVIAGQSVQLSTIALPGSGSLNITEKYISFPDSIDAEFGGFWSYQTHLKPVSFSGDFRRSVIGVSPNRAYFSATEFASLKTGGSKNNSNDRRGGHVLRAFVKRFDDTPLFDCIEFYIGFIANAEQNDNSGVAQNYDVNINVVGECESTYLPFYFDD